ncbi:type IV pilus twitching motility protein PilT [Neomoorella thermoacetica]|uniref:Twitching mobility protein n=1 Tax=Neomoorella thermoacetica TaxID=1525 RepID=A0A1J5JVS6_NEOTH|nr:twitching mobility protein [Moorella thermoacetica]
MILVLNEIEALLRFIVDIGASDLHLTAGIPPVVRLQGRLIKLPDMAAGTAGTLEQEAIKARSFLADYPGWEQPLTPETIGTLGESLLEEERHRQRFLEKGSVDLACSLKGISRFRLNVYRQRGTVALAARALARDIPSLDGLFSFYHDLPQTLKRLALLPRGLILVTGPTGSGKSTTLAAMVDWINKQAERHIITLEDPIEYLHRHGKSIVNQREVGEDVESFAEGLRAALREDPDVILVGEMRDWETMATAISAAETGHLVLSTLHTRTAADAVERIIDAFPPHQQQQIRIQMAGVLEGVISQQLLPRRDDSGRVAAVEVLVATPAVRALIREGKTHQLPSAIQTGAREGMLPMDKALAQLYLAGIVEREAALERAVDGEILKRFISRTG